MLVELQKEWDKVSVHLPFNILGLIQHYKNVFVLQWVLNFKRVFIYVKNYF